MSAMLLLLLCLVAGIVLRQSGRLSDTAPAALNSNVIHAAMGPMIGAAVVANHYKLDSALTSLMVGIGIPLALLVAPLWLGVAQSMA